MLRSNPEIPRLQYCNFSRFIKDGYCSWVYLNLLWIPQIMNLEVWDRPHRSYLLYCSCVYPPPLGTPYMPPAEPSGFGSEFCSAAYNLCTEPIAFVLLQIVLRKQVSVWEHADTHRASVISSIGSMQGYIHRYCIRHVSRQIKLVIQSCLLSNN